MIRNLHGNEVLGSCDQRVIFLLGARKGNLLRKVRSAVDEVYKLPNGAVQATTRIAQLFMCGIFVTLAILTLGRLRHQYGISGRESSRFAQSSSESE